MTALRRLACAALLLAAACGGEPEDDGRGPLPDAGAPAVDAHGQPVLTAAESAAAVQAVEAHARSVAERMRREAGFPPDDVPPPPLPPGEPAPRTRAECMDRAARSSGPDEREVLERFCERLPTVP